MADLVAKQLNFVSRAIEVSERIVAAHDDLAALVEEYNALDYGNVLLPAAFAGDSRHLSINDVVALMVTYAALETVMDAGHRTNLLNMKG